MIIAILKDLDEFSPSDVVGSFQTLMLVSEDEQNITIAEFKSCLTVKRFRTHCILSLFFGVASDETLCKVHYVSRVSIFRRLDSCL